MKKSLFISLLLVVFTNVKAQIVTTQFGDVQGSMNGTIHQFLGIPFAKPPVGELRWKAPQTPDAWTQTLNTTAFAPVCPQKAFSQNQTTGTNTGNEDCLYLNVWTPQTGAANKAVMVFIHGGGNQQGGASEVSSGTQLYFGKNMAERGDVVVVTIQYRLGPLGFLVHPGLDAESASGKSGNYAVLDQILALQWVKNNIAAFGGNPDNVMIFGESAGAVNVGNLMLTPLAANLFHKAGIESGIPVVGAYSDVENSGVAFVDSFITTGTATDKIAYMRSLPADSLLYMETSPIQGGLVQKNWQPALDHVVFTDYPINVIQSGNFNKVPLIIGSNADEMSLSAPQTVTPAMVNALISSSIPLAYQAQTHTQYPSGTTNAEARTSYVGLLTDSQFTATARRIARCISQNQTEPVYRYLFSHKHTIPQLQTYGSYHGMELFYVFNNWENTTLGTGSFFKPADDSVQINLLNYWTNFAKTGNPNGGSLVTWPQYEANADCYLEIKATPNNTQCGLRTAKCDLWDQMMAFHGCTSSLNGIDELEVGNQIIANPNPSSGLINLVGDIDWKHTTIKVVDLSGKEIMQLNGTNSLDFSDKKSGLYIIQVMCEGRTQNIRFIKN